MEEIFTMFAAMLSAIFTLMVDSFPMGCCKKRSSQLNVSASTNHKRAKEGHVVIGLSMGASDNLRTI
ncbi:unnamed protein product [Malus baccata var. baccata]